MLSSVGVVGVGRIDGVNKGVSRGFWESMVLVEVELNGCLWVCGARVRDKGRGL